MKNQLGSMICRFGAWYLGSFFWSQAPWYHASIFPPKKGAPETPRRERVPRTWVEGLPFFHQNTKSQFLFQYVHCLFRNGEKTLGIDLNNIEFKAVTISKKRRDFIHSAGQERESQGILQITSCKDGL